MLLNPTAPTRVLTPTATPPNLAPLASLDADRDGRLTVRDARMLERTDRWLGQQARIGAALAPTAPASAPSSTVAGLLPTALPAGSAGPVDAVRGVEMLGVDALRRTGVNIVSTFDFDNTIADGDIMAPVFSRLGRERLLDPSSTAFRELMERFAIPSSVTGRAADANDDAQDVMRAVHQAGRGVDRALLSGAFYASSTALKGASVEQARAVAREVVRGGVPELGIAPLRERMFDASDAAGDGVLDMWRASEQRGITPWVVTFGFEWIAQEAAAELGLPTERVVGWNAEQADGRFLGVSAADNDKHSMIRDRIGGVPVFALGDSGSDLPMLDMALARSLVINPSASMLDADRQRGGRFTLVDYPK